MEVLQQVPKGGVLFFYITKVDLRVEIDGTEHIAEFAAVVLLNMRQCYIDLLADFGAVALAVEVIKGGLPIHREPLPAHGTLHTALIAVILGHVPFTLFLGDIAQVLHKQHRQDIVLVTGTIDLSTETVTGFPEDSFNISTSSHFSYLFSNQ